MYRNSISRMALLWQIEWRKRWKLLAGFIAISMSVLLLTAIIPAQNMEITPSFLPLHLIIDLLFLFIIQMATLFPEWNNPFQSIQFIQVPATIFEKFLVRLSFPLFVAPCVYLIAFLLIKPVCLLLCFRLTGFVIHPFYGFEVWSFGGSTYLTLFVMAILTLPGAFYFKKGHLLKSILLYLSIFIFIGIFAALFNLPLYTSMNKAENVVSKMFAAQIQGVSLVYVKNKLIISTIWLGVILPLLLYTSYILFKQREV
ncbi:hypothetical protein [Haliscomenobacter sp.]|uniref:hypothetical protein n=1 Tax=Haliscomenobacter sp. TaxID=2717303 RepID=UPI003BACB5AF